jgi:polysaccharide deacetylase family protein (PEP-CTERM system associated)
VSGTAQRVANVLSVDVEDWFQVENFSTVLPSSTWHQCELRVERNVHFLLERFSAANVRATFFVLGWVAENLPGLVREIAQAGHEIASHGWSHTPIWRLTPAAFEAEAVRSRAFLQDLSGQPVLGYRAPTFSVTSRTLWALGILAASGYAYDSSIFPVRHDRYGIPDAPLDIHRRPEGVWEIPLSVISLGRLRLPVAGGGYFRLYPWPLTRAAIHRLNASGRPGIVYLHPWEFDPGQPTVKGVSRLRTFRHRVGLSSSAQKLTRLLREFSFGPAHDALPLDRTP